MKSSDMMVFLTMLAFVVLFLIIQPYFEMQSFNRFSETKATYWDALFADLRIIPGGNK